MSLKDKIAIRPSELTDAEELFAMVKESIESTYPAQAWCHPGYMLKDAQDWISHGQKMREEGREYHWVIYASDTKRLLGTTSMIRVDRANLLAQTGYFVRETARGKGIAGAACLLTAQFAFQELKLHRLELLIPTHNQNSIRVAEKIAAEREGVLKDRLKWNDTFHDAYLYTLISTCFL